jgi:hypothetical protein
VDEPDVTTPDDRRGLHRREVLALGLLSGGGALIGLGGWWVSPRPRADAVGTSRAPAPDTAAPPLQRLPPAEEVAPPEPVTRADRQATEAADDTAPTESSAPADTPATERHAETDPPAQDGPSDAPHGDDPDLDVSDPASAESDPEGEPAAGDEAGDPAPTDPEGDDEPDPVAVGGHLEVLCRDALGLAVAGAAVRSHTIDTFTLHHTEFYLERNALAPKHLRRHQRFHRSQGWSDIAYHYAVDLRGNVYELRDPGSAGDTFTAYDPTGHLLVVCEGNYNYQQPTDALLAALADLFASASVTHGVPLDRLDGHRDLAPKTSCPGEYLYPQLAAIRREAITRVRAGAPAIHRVCGAEGRQRVAAIEAAT